MNLIDIDVIGLKAAKAIFDRCHKVFARRSCFIQTRARWVPCFRRDDRSVTLTLEGGAKVFLGASLKIGVSRVEVCDSQFQSPIDDFRRAWLINLVSERIATEANSRDRHPCRAELAIFHISPPFPSTESIESHDNCR